MLAAPLVAEHKARLLEARPRIVLAWRHEYKPGREHVGPDGGRIFATDRELYHLDAQGVTIRTTPNGEPEHRIINLERRLGIPYAPIEITEAAQLKLAVKNGDDALFETYLQHANITGYYEREARAVWALYKQLTDNKPLKDATRDDGRKLAESYRGQKIKSATIQKKIGWLTAAVNLAIKEGRLTFNPFSSIVPRRDDEQKRLPLSDGDIKSTKHNLGQLRRQRSIAVPVARGDRHEIVRSIRD